MAFAVQIRQQLQALVSSGGSHKDHDKWVVCGGVVVEWGQLWLLSYFLLVLLVILAYLPRSKCKFTPSTLFLSLCRWFTMLLDAAAAAPHRWLGQCGSSGMFPRNVSNLLLNGSVVVQLSHPYSCCHQQKMSLWGLLLFHQYPLSWCETGVTQVHILGAHNLLLLSYWTAPSTTTLPVIIQ